MESLAEYLANYIDREIDKQIEIQWLRNYIPDRDDYQDWLEQGIDAYESIYGVRVRTLDEQEFELLNGD